MTQGEIFSSANVSRETIDKLRAYSAMVEKWSSTINLVSRSNVSEVMERHIADSVQLLNLAPNGWKHWADLGSGGGFPGLVVAICVGTDGLDRTITLVESDQRKAVFLREAARIFELGVQVINERIEDIVGLQADILSARALAPLSALCGHADRHMKRQGSAIFPKGANHLIEIEHARSAWRFNLNIVASKTSDGAAILVLKDIENA